jgi:short-subunit dehydrogenase
MGQLHGAVVAITGASSGIGWASALAFARRGARPVLAARSPDALHELAVACEREGVAALAVPTDVADEAAVTALANAAMDRFGRIDVWVNNAAVGVYGRFEDVPPAEFRRVVETNFFGYVYGARAVWPHFQRQGHGVLINNASVLGRAAGPYFSAYNASKFAVCGFTESLRQEVLGSDVHVCLVVPASIDTPFYQHAGNYSGRRPKALTPVYDAQQVASAIVACAERPRREVQVGQAATLMTLLHTLSPSLYERMMRRQFEVDAFETTPASPSPGSLFEPRPPLGAVSGGWQARGDTSLPHLLTAMATRLAPVALRMPWTPRRGGAVPARASRPASTR